MASLELKRLKKLQFNKFLFKSFFRDRLITFHNLLQLNNETKTKFEQICKNGFPSFRHGDVTFWDYNRLKFCLEFNNEYAFVEGLKVITTKKPKELLIFDSNDFNSNYGKILSLMGKADQCGLYRALEALNSNERINFEAIKLHCKNGSWQSLQIWLEKRKQMEWKRIKLSDVIANLMNAKNYDRMLRNVDGIWIKSKEINFSKCVDLLFDYADYEVNEQYEENYSALHLAVMYNRPAAIIKLFRNGAYIGLKDKHNRPAIWNIEPKLLEKCFDLCIEEWQTDGPCIVFNFRNLIAPSKFYPNDMTAIEYISVTKTIHHLIEHPLIASYLFFKWNRLALLFYVDLLCNLVFTLAMSVISILYLADPETYLFTMYVFTAMFTTYVMVRRFFQTIYSSKSYLQSQPNIQKSVLQVSIVVFLLLFMIFCNPVWISFFIILITIEFFMLAGTYCHSSIYFEMFIVVFKNFVKSLILYAIFLPAFSVLFYILLRNPMPVQENGESNFNNFPTFGASVVKTIVMSTGEFDASDINFNVEDLNFNVNTISICVFIGFIFVISTVFMNLLSGLAVSDIQKLRSKARLTSLKRRIQALARYEDSLLYGNFWCRYVASFQIFVFKPFFSFKFLFF